VQGGFPREVWAHTIQPNGYDNEPFKSHKYEPGELELYVTEAEAAINANAIYHFTGEIDRLTYRPSAKNCHWCAGFPLCNAAREAAISFPTSTGPYGPDELAAALRKAEFLETWIKEIKALALDTAKSGVDVPGRKLVQKVGHRKFTGEHEKVAAKLFDIAYISYDECMPRSLISPSEAEKLIKAKLKGTTQKKTSALVQLEELVERPGSGNLDLVPLDDKRPAVDPRKQLFGSNIVAVKQEREAT
jgi:hypothetical protein